MVISYWLTSRHLFVDPQLLWQMRNFCIAAGSMKSSVTMHDKARDLMRLIDDRVREPPFPIPGNMDDLCFFCSQIKIHRILRFPFRPAGGSLELRK